MRLIAEGAMVAQSYRLCQKHYPIPYDLKRIAEYFLLTATIYFGSVYGLKGLSEDMHFVCNTLLFCGAIGYAIWREKIDIKGLIKAVIGKFVR